MKITRNKRRKKVGSENVVFLIFNITINIHSIDVNSHCLTNKIIRYLELIL